MITYCFQCKSPLLPGSEYCRKCRVSLVQKTENAEAVELKQEIAKLEAEYNILDKEVDKVCRQRSHFADIYEFHKVLKGLHQEMSRIEPKLAMLKWRLGQLQQVEYGEGIKLERV